MADKLTQLLLSHDKGRDYYVPSDFDNASLKSMKDEYTRMRDIARKRIARLEKKGILFPEDIQRFKEMYPKIGEIDQRVQEMVKEHPNEITHPDIVLKQQMRYALSDVSKLLNKEATTIPKAQKLAQQRAEMFRIAKEKIGFSDDIKERAWWKFVDYTKNVISDNVYYWTERKTKYLHDNKTVIDKINNYNFGAAVDDIQDMEMNVGMERLNRAQNAKDYDTQIRNNFADYWRNT